MFTLQPEQLARSFSSTLAQRLPYAAESILGDVMASPVDFCPTQAILASHRALEQSLCSKRSCLPWICLTDMTSGASQPHRPNFQKALLVAGLKWVVKRTLAWCEGQAATPLGQCCRRMVGGPMLRGVWCPGAASSLE